MRIKYLLKTIGFIVLQEVVIERPEVDILEKIKKTKSKDEDIVRIVEEMKKARVKNYEGTSSR